MQLILTTVIAGFLALIIGFFVIWSNPSRAVNRLFLTLSIHVALWLFSLRMVYAGGDDTAVFWIRLTTAIGGAIPGHAWLVKECIAESLNFHDRRWRRRFAVWMAASIALVVICYTGYFIPSYSTAIHRIRGWGFYAHTFGALVLWGLLAYETYRDTRRTSGVRRVELQLWLVGVCGVALAIVVLMALSSMSNGARYTRYQPLMILIFYIGTALATTTHRIFDARQIVLFGLENLLLIFVIATVGLALFRGLQIFLPDLVSLLVTIAVIRWLAALLSAWLDRKLKLFPHATEARMAAFVASRRETQPARLEQAFLGVIRGWGQTDSGLILVGGDGVLRGGNLEIVGESPAMVTLRQLRWATPERLVRERSTPEREELAKFLTDRRLGLVVTNDSAAISVVAGVGIPVSRRPYTYPQVTQLMELVSIFEGAFERASLSEKAQHAEQLATVGLLGASLAHEIRNPLVTIKTIVQLLPSHHDDPAFRNKFFKLMTDEITRIDRLTDQLLDLASPRAYVPQTIELHAVLRASLELVTPKASENSIEIRTDFGAKLDSVYCDPSAIKQVLLNLCFNAIQAIDNRMGDRWLKISTQNVRGQVEMVVTDSGPGISKGMHARLFQPFQSTKSTGFGLGLAICRDIMTGLNASISVDPPVQGQGATFRVALPCQPPLS